MRFKVLNVNNFISSSVTEPYELYERVDIDRYEYILLGTTRTDISAFRYYGG